MCKIIKLIEKYFPNSEAFTPTDLYFKTGINPKILAMNLKKLNNSLRIGYYSTNNSYYDWGIETCINERKRINEIIEKYNLKQKKFKI